MDRVLSFFVDNFPSGKTIAVGGPLFLAWNFAWLGVAGHLKMGRVDSRPLRELHIPGPIAAPLQLDGDFLEFEPPLVIRLSDHRIRLLMPQRQKQ